MRLADRQKLYVVLTNPKLAYGENECLVLRENEKLPICNLKLPNRDVAERIESIISLVSFQQDYEDIYNTKFELK